MQSRFATLALLALTLTSVPTHAQTRGILNQPAPSWQVDRWHNVAKTEQAPDIIDYHGRVVFLYGFQSWCPGCHSQGFPTLTKLIDDYDQADDVAFVAIQTTFEGFETNNAAAARQTARRYKLDIPVAHSGSNGKRSQVMTDYRTGGTPWTVIIDKKGIVRYNDFHVTVERAHEIIDELRVVDVPRPPKLETLPKSRGGQDRIAKRFPPTRFDALYGTHESGGVAIEEPKAPAKATLYRWWTDSCPYCVATLPALETLHEKYADDGLRIVAVYHPKPPREINHAEVVAAARKRGFNGEVAIDQNWTNLRRAYLSAGGRRATSVSFLVDGRGFTRFLHPGPVFHPSDDPAEAQQDADYKLVEQAVASVLSVAMKPEEPETEFPIKPKADPNDNQ